MKKRHFSLLLKMGFCGVPFFTAANDLTINAATSAAAVYISPNQSAGALTADKRCLNGSNIGKGLYCVDKNSDGPQLLASSDSQLPGNPVLPSNSIGALLIDASDKVWVGTSKGIGSYDGTAWTIYPRSGDTLPGPDASALAMDSSGVLWAGFSQPIIMSSIQCGLACFTQQHWRRISTDHVTIKAITIDGNGDIWTARENGVFRNYGSNQEKLFETLYSSDAETALGTRVNTIALDDGGTPWIGTGLGVKRYEDNGWVDDTLLGRSIVSTAGASLHGGVAVNAIWPGRFGVTWIGTANGLYKSTGGSYERFDTAGGVLPHQTVLCIAVESAGSAWVGTMGGLVHFNGTSRITYTTANSALKDNAVTACAIARNGDVWAGTASGGLAFLPKSATNVHTWRASELKPGIGKAGITCTPVSRNVNRIAITSEKSAPVALSLFSVDGKHVRRFTAAATEHASVVFMWDGTDCYGKRVRCGVYPGVVTANGKVLGTILVPRQ